MRNAQLVTWAGADIAFLARSVRAFARMASHAICAPANVGNLSRQFLPSLVLLGGDEFHISVKL